MKLKKISLILQIGGIDPENFALLTWFIKQSSSSLIYLSLNIVKIYTNQSYINGYTLQQQFLETMIQMKSFHFYMKLDRKPTNLDYFLSTFQTQFWLDHHWTFGIHGIYVYTLPFHFDTLEDFIDFDQIKSTNSIILNSPKAWSYVKSIDAPESSKLSLNLAKQLKLKMPNLTSIIISFKQVEELCTVDDQTNKTDITLDTITTVRCGSEDLQTIKRWLIPIFPNTSHLILSYGPHWAGPPSNRMVLTQNFHTTDYIYFSKVQYVDITFRFKELDCLYEHVIRLVNELLEIFKNPQSFTFRFHEMPGFPHINPFTDLIELIRMLNMENISEKYQIKHTHNHLQLLRRDNE